MILTAQGLLYSKTVVAKVYSPSESNDLSMYSLDKPPASQPRQPPTNTSLVVDSIQLTFHPALSTI
jgi:hypothetical protein